MVESRDFLRRARLDAVTLEAWIEAGWLVPRPVEVLGAELYVDQQAVERLLGQQDRAEDGGLRLEVLGRDLA